MGIASPPRCGFAGPLLAPTKSPHIQLLPPAPPQIFFSLLSPLLSAAALAERERATRTEAEQPGWRAARGGGGGGVPSARFTAAVAGAGAVRRASRGAGRGARGRGALAVVVVVASVASWAWSARFYRRRMATGESDSHLGGRLRLRSGSV